VRNQMEGIETRIWPSEAELREARRMVETSISSFETAVDTGDVKFYLGWQELDGKVSYTVGNGSVNLFLNPEEEWQEEVQKNVLRALLGVEYLDKKDFETTEFIWQDIAMQAYTKSRESQIRDFEPTKSALEIEWAEVKDMILENDAGAVYSIIPGLTSILSENSTSAILEMNRSEIVESLEESLG